MKTTTDIISEIEKKMQDLIIKGVHTLYLFSQRITQETAMNVKNHFEDLGFDIEVRSCPRKQWDIIVRF